MAKICRGALTVAPCLAVALVRPPARAAEPTPGSSATITLAQVLELVRRENPQIAAARRRWEAARQRVVQEATPPKPRLDLERMYGPVPRDPIGGAKEKNVALTQELPFPTSLVLLGRKASQQAEIAEQAYRARVREVEASAEQTYAAWFLAQRSAEIFDENVAIMRRFSRVAESKYAAGHSGQLDALKAQAELTRMLNMAIVVDQERQTAEAALDALLNRDARAPLPLAADPDPGALDLRLDALQAEAAAGRPELRQAELEARQAATELSLARSEFLPDLMLQARYRASPSEGDSRDAILGLSLPLWFWKPAAKVAEARAEEAGAEAELQALRVSTSADLKAAWLRAQTARRLADIYRTTLLPQAQASLRVAESGYQAGGSSFLDLLDAQRSLLNYRLEHFQDLAEYERRLAELERVVGRRLTP